MMQDGTYYTLSDVSDDLASETDDVVSYLMDQTNIVTQRLTALLSAYNDMMEVDRRSEPHCDCPICVPIGGDSL